MNLSDAIEFEKDRAEFRLIVAGIAEHLQGAATEAFGCMDIESRLVTATELVSGLQRAVMGATALKDQFADLDRIARRIDRRAGRQA